MFSWAALVLVPVVTWVAYQLHLNLAATGFLQLLVVLAFALRAGFWQATAASLVANVCLNYFFVPPLFSFYITDPQNWIALGVFEISALVVSRLSTQAQLQTARAIHHERELERLYEFSRALLLLIRTKSPGPQIVALIQRVFLIDAAVLWDALDAKVDAIGGDAVELESETRAAYLHDRDPQISDGTIAGPIWIRVLRTGVRPIGAIGMRGNVVTPITANALASLVAIALERARAFERESQAEAERKSEQLRTVVLDALAHEYKTPLTSLGTASSGLIAMGQLNPIQLELVSLIDSEVRRLDGLTTRLLQMSRLDRADVRLRPERIDPDELLQTVLAGMQAVLAGHPVRVEGLDSGAFIKADRELVSMALTQFLDNAAKYSNPAGLITVSIAPAPAEVQISVHNVGPFIPAEDRERIFQRFYRSPASSHKAAGTGIGLSISRKVADAHQGRVWVTSDELAGNTFSLALPKYRSERA